jgi:hypothetical protein
MHPLSVIAGVLAVVSLLLAVLSFMNAANVLPASCSP